MKLQNTSLQQHVQEKLDGYRRVDDRLGLDYTLIRQNEFTLTDTYDFEIYTISNGKLYTLRYEDDALKVPETLP
jgi:hypothetical protein